ncbi:hypothetical protein [Endozoicomonas sp. SESOKO1]|uniref:hypothetical protein n=1 Tax=Endozoicomonas sp. SESOKO1 TaxID=2828742 RepID=UPI002147A95C|nr:hypothetical protein [Endozoicomonas sp. SESOKO1]
MLSNKKYSYSHKCNHLFHSFIKLIAGFVITTAVISNPSTIPMAYSETGHPENNNLQYSIVWRAVPLLTETLFSIERLHEQSPMLSLVLKNSLLQAAHAVSRINNRYIISYRDIKALNDYAKTTRHGYYELSFKNKRIYFIANEDIANQVIALEGQGRNLYTNRRLLSAQNWFLLENNPVAAGDMHHHTYGRKQAALFQQGFERLQQLPDISVLLANQPTPEFVYGTQAADLISNLLTQIYFQLLFASVSPEYPVDKIIQQQVNKHYYQIKRLYDQLEAHTGKYDLKANRFIQGNSPFAKNHPYSNIQTLEQFYKVLCLLYDESLSPDIPGNHQSIRETVAIRTLALLRKHNAAVLPVFAPSLTQSLDNVSPQEAINIVFNLLSWIDNSLNISNTATNFVIHVAEHHQNQHLIDMHQLFAAEVHNLRALATLFPRKVNRSFRVTTTSETAEHSIHFKPGDTILITNAIKGHAFGYEPRKCPSRPYSVYILPAFLQYFFENYHARYDVRSKLIPNSTSWFWNKLDVTPLVLEPAHKVTAW